MPAPAKPQLQLATAGPWRGEELVGEGASARVWRATHVESGARAALKIAKAGASLTTEADVIARLGRRWGPAILDAGDGFIAMEWTEGRALHPASLRKDRERVAAIVAHGVARALEELHDAGVRHGDVKPSNVVVTEAKPKRDCASERGATLIDLGLSHEVGAGQIGGTPRYMAPEARGLDDPGPAADLWALGVMLAETLDATVAASEDACDAWERRASGGGEIARWIDALLARSPGARPSAAWIAARAARVLGLREDEDERVRADVARVKRAYLAARVRDIRGGGEPSDAIGGVARTWLDEAIAWASKLAPAERTRVEPMTAMVRARWIVSLVGPSAAAWPIDEVPEGELAARLVALANERAPATWTIDDLGGASRAAPVARDWQETDAVERVARLARELGAPQPDAGAIAAAEDVVAQGEAPTALAVALAEALVRGGEIGRAWAALAGAGGAEVDALRADIARRRGDKEEAERAATRALVGPARSRAMATLARLAWDVGDYDRAESLLDGARGAAPAEVRALVAYARGAHESGLRTIEQALAETRDAAACARLEATRGLLEHAHGRAADSARALRRAVEIATRSGAIVDEATYLTTLAAAATDAGDVAGALSASSRAALLWERLGRRGDAARAWLARAGALATIGATHAADEASGEARARALAVGDRRAAVFARWARIEVRAPGDPTAEAEARAADEELGAAAAAEDRVRAAARLLVWAPRAIDDARVAATDAAVATTSAPARWEWWGARAAAILAGRGDDHATVLSALSALVDVAAPLGARGPALDAAARLATERSDGDAARRFDLARRAAARTLREGTPAAWSASLAHVAWARAAAEVPDVTFAPAQIAQLESIVRALGTRDRLRPLLEQVLDTMVLWTGVERGLLLLRAPDGRLVPRTARNLARRDLVGDQLTLSQGIARRAMESGDAVVATDAFSTLGDMHASVHALKLRSVLAVPLVARGETLGVVYLDDRARKGAFGERELAWVRVVASQAAVAIADARDQVLLKRAARRAERAKREIESLLHEREAELDATKAKLEMTTREGTRYRYDAIIGKSEQLRAMLKLVDRVTATDIPVLLVGESGTGKELVARAIHANGARASKPFVGENCAAVPEPLLESTLFGHVRGAFTGAASTRAGLFDVADGGTLFLDEIGEMPLTMQTKLLRVLQDGEVRAVGSERTRKVNVRVIGATHRDLEAMVASGQFREDLFYRLNVITVRVPALRERADDIPLLVAHFAAKHGEGRERVPKVTRAAMDRLVAYPWPGNIRQLENEIRRAIVLADDRIDVTDLSADVARGGPSAARGTGHDLRSRVDALEAELVREALDKTRGNQTRAAEMLGLSRFGLQKMIKRLGIAVPR